MASWTSSDLKLWVTDWGDSSKNIDISSYVFANKEINLIPERIIFNDKTTICFWEDGTKTVVKCASDENFIPEVGVAECIVKKIFGSRAKFLKTVKKAYWQPQNDKKKSSNE